jgi:hypothetical protein
LPLQTILRTRAAAANGIMLDIGANIGLMSVTRALLGDIDVVYSAEPAPDSFACLTRNVLENGLQGVATDRIAISDQTGEAQLELAGSIGARALRDLGTCRTGRRCRAPARFEARFVIDARARFMCRRGSERLGIDSEAGAGRSPAQLIAQLQTAFSHFVDLSSRGARATTCGASTNWPTQWLISRPGHFTDLLLYRSSPL